MGYSATLAANTSEDWNKILAYMQHIETCEECEQDPRVLSVEIDDPNKTLSAELSDMDWTLPTHES